MFGVTTRNGCYVRGAVTLVATVTWDKGCILTEACVEDAQDALFLYLGILGIFAARASSYLGQFPYPTT